MIAEVLTKHIEATVQRLKTSGISVAQRKELPYGVQLGLSGYGASCKVNFYYSKKKGISVVQAGGDKSFLNMVLKMLGGASVSSGIAVPPGLRAGSDEAGKGDYFGPLVVAAVACNQSTSNALSSMGVGDSKKLSAAKVRELYEKMIVMNDVRYSVCAVSPREYNRLFDAFREEGKNSLDTLAMAHGRAFDELLAKGSEPDRVVIDKFCEMR
ncbi:MAG: hypothetical protein GY852_11475, partial [bacterium]|nr:hypothetical protein [bacterium]